MCAIIFYFAEHLDPFIKKCVANEVNTFAVTSYKIFDFSSQL
jgi:hypothetical protein